MPMPGKSRMGERLFAHSRIEWWNIYAYPAIGSGMYSFSGGSHMQIIVTAATDTL